MAVATMLVLSPMHKFELGPVRFPTAIRPKAALPNPTSNFVRSRVLNRELCGACSEVLVVPVLVAVVLVDLCTFYSYCCCCCCYYCCYSCCFVLVGVVVVIGSFCYCYCFYYFSVRLFLLGRNSSAVHYRERCYLQLRRVVAANIMRSAWSSERTEPPGCCRTTMPRGRLKKASKISATQLCSLFTVHCSLFTARYVVVARRCKMGHNYNAMLCTLLPKL